MCYQKWYDFKIVWSAGICSCEAQFRGSDCSIPAGQAPGILQPQLTCNGFCKTVVVVGSGFFESDSMQCEFTKIEVSQQSSHSSVLVESHLSYLNIMVPAFVKISCQLLSVQFVADGVFDSQMIQVWPTKVKVVITCLHHVHL